MTTTVHYREHNDFSWRSREVNGIREARNDRTMDLMSRRWKRQRAIDNAKQRRGDRQSEVLAETASLLVIPGLRVQEIGLGLRP
jgi:transcription initiation factor TFIIIB Brf1 subunit/transcription initiation factor TFIIB